jgi:hypothetical protein
VKYPTPPVVTVNRITGQVDIDFDKDFDFTPEAAERVRRTILDTFPVRHILTNRTIANMEALAYQLQEEAFERGELISKIPFKGQGEEVMSEMGKPSFHVVTWRENERESGITMKIQLVNPDGIPRGLLLQIPDEYLIAMCSVQGEQFYTRFLRRDDMYDGERGHPDSEFDPSTATPYQLLHHLWTKAVGTADYVKAEWRELERKLTT